ncbi:MAG TPA: NAD(P)H-hydrate dehydratase [Gammaproteobacteria bacterium]|jgi:NAD(P)H-hydrate epimerase|nr:NAD(P)H-hydrate dehydratase [Gammaproteobacteria bacterium]
MPALPETLFTAAQVRELDLRAMEKGGIPAQDLMQQAGVAAWQLLSLQWPAATRILVLCGAGNNAGDGYVVAEQALSQGRAVRLVTLGDSDHLPATAAGMRGRYLKAGGKEEKFAGSLPEADVVVDALLGTGLDRPLSGDWLKAVQMLNASGRPVLSLDIPSGLNADTGAELGVAVRAQVTLTFIALKAGMFTGAGPECCGLLRFDDLKVPETLSADMAPRALRLRSSGMRGAKLPRRPRDSHKGDFGHVLVVGGDHGMGGAVRLTAEAALRCGAGLVSVATRAAHVDALLAGLPEAMVRGVERPEDLSPMLARAGIVAIGPGLGQDVWGQSLLKQVLTSSLPLVVDADALNLLAQAPQKRGNWILTPHPGEAGRLWGTDTAAVQHDRYAAAENLARRFGAVTVLKGAGSLIAVAGETTAVCTAGNPGMAAPGMGDVLTGVIAALAAQGLSLADAARMGVYVHASAGDLAARQGERGLMARDLMEPLKRLVNV